MSLKWSQGVKLERSLSERSRFCGRSLVLMQFHLIHSPNWMYWLMIAHTTGDIRLFIHKCCRGNPQKSLIQIPLITAGWSRTKYRLKYTLGGGVDKQRPQPVRGCRKSGCSRFVKPRRPPLPCLPLKGWLCRWCSRMSPAVAATPTLFTTAVLRLRLRIHANRLASTRLETRLYTVDIESAHLMLPLDSASDRIHPLWEQKCV